MSTIQAHSHHFGDADRAAPATRRSLSPTLFGARVVLRPARPRDKGPLGEYLAVSPWAWVITVAGRDLGTAHLRVFADQQAAEYGIAIFDPHRQGRGYGTEATRLVLDYAFTQLQLASIGLQVLATNRRAIACYSKCGFVTWALCRDAGLSFRVMLCANPACSPTPAAEPTLMLTAPDLQRCSTRITLRRQERAYLGMRAEDRVSVTMQDGVLLLRRA